MNATNKKHDDADFIRAAGYRAEINPERAAD